MVQVPLTIDTNDGYTFSGIETTTFAPRSVGPPSPVNLPANVPPPTTTLLSGTVPGPGATVILGYSREERSGYLSGCPTGDKALSCAEILEPNLTLAVAQDKTVTPEQLTKPGQIFS